MRQVILRYGVYSLLLASAIFLSALVLGKDLSFSTQEVIGYTSMVVSQLFIFFGILHYRNKINNGKVTFGRALLIGILISAFAGLGFAIIDFIYTTIINPDFMSDYIEMQKESGYEGEIAEFSSGFMAFIMFATVLIIGFILSLLSALILQRK